MAFGDQVVRIGVSWSEVRVVVRLLAALLFVLASFNASALVQPVQQWRGVTDGQSTAYFPTKAQACAAASPLYNTEVKALGYTSGRTAWEDPTCQGYATVSGSESKNGTVPLQGGESACPANSDPVTGGCQCRAGYPEVGGQCQANQCAADTGKVGLVTWTEGYTTTPDEGDTKAVAGSLNPVPASGSICQGGCNVSAQVSGPGVEFYVSQQPTSQGLYRRSRIMPTVGLGTPCTASDQAANSPVAAEPQCPGSVGLVGNKVACLSTPAKPVPTADMGPPPVPPLAGNPAAGAVPTSGPGSTPGSAGRTPDAGTGGNAGGGAGAAVGGRGGSGTGAGAAAGTGTGGGKVTNGRVTNPGDGTEQAACGAPDQPVCAVKVDESGVPIVGDFSAASTKLGEHQDKVSEAIGQAQGMQAPEWSFSFQLPTGCTAYTPAAFEEFGVSINPCNWQGTIHDLMSMIWAAVTAFCIIGMVGRTIRES